MSNNKTTSKIAQFRHKAEKPLLILGYVLTITILLLCFWVVYTGVELKMWTYLVLGGLFIPFFGNYAANLMYYKNIIDEININENQLPELYALYKEVAFKMGFTEEQGKYQIPPLYVVNGFGSKKFFSSKSPFYQKFIVLESDIANLIYEEKPNIRALRFIIAHHLASIKCNHTNRIRLAIYPLMRLLFLNKLLSKAEQYTADRMACYYFFDDIDAVIALHITAIFGERVNEKSYFEDIEKHKKKSLLKFANVLNGGLAYQRIKTLKEAQSKGWDIHGKIF